MLSSSNAKEKLRGLTSVNKYRLLKILDSRNRVWFGQKCSQLLSSSLQIRSEKADCDLWLLSSMHKVYYFPAVQVQCFVHPRSFLDNKLDILPALHHQREMCCLQQIQQYHQTRNLRESGCCMQPAEIL